MKLLLKKIKWVNFMSTGNRWTEVDLCSKKTTLIVGKNGSGKSTLLDAISFGLFNKPFRSITKPQLVNSITNKDCMVEIEFEINGYQFLVRRGIKPNIFEIFKDGKLITEAAVNRDYQTDLEKNIIRINHKTFCQIVILGSAIFVPFMKLPAAKRREFIDDVWNLQFFTTMGRLLSDLIKDTEKKIDENENAKHIILKLK